MIEEIIARPRTGRRVSEIKQELGETMNQYVAVYRDQEGLEKAQEIVKRLQEESKSAYIDDKGTVFNQDVLGAIELGYMLDCAEATVLGRSSARSRVARSSAPTSPSATTSEWLKHIDISLNGDGPEIGYSPVTFTQWQPEERKY